MRSCIHLVLRNNGLIGVLAIVGWIGSTLHGQDQEDWWWTGFYPYVYSTSMGWSWVDPHDDGLRVFDLDSAQVADYGEPQIDNSPFYGTYSGKVFLQTVADDFEMDITLTIAEEGDGGTVALPRHQAFGSNIIPASDNDPLVRYNTVVVEDALNLIWSQTFVDFGQIGTKDFSGNFRYELTFAEDFTVIVVIGFHVENGVGDMAIGQLVKQQ